MRRSKFSTLNPVSYEATWVLLVQEIFQRLEIPPGIVADNLVSSISLYCQTFHPQGLQSNDLCLLIARAFCAVGDRAAARQVLESMDPQNRHAVRWLEILSELDHFPQLLPYFSRGVIRPADWAGAQLDRMWTLDFGRLLLTEAERHEIMIHRSVRMLIEQMVLFWDATNGEGILGLKNLATFNVEEGSATTQTLTRPEDWLEYIAALFRQQIKIRSWRTTPVLLNLDL